MKKRVFALLSAIALLLALVGGCSGDPSSNSPSGGNGDTPNVIKFGAALPLTGGLAMEGEKHQKGYDLWAEETNKAGGITVDGKQYQVEMVYYDYKSDNATAVKLAEKLITEDKVNFLFGPMGSAAAKAVSAVTEKYQIPMISPSASSEEVFTEGYKYHFGTFTPNATLTEPLADIAKEKGVTSIAIVSRNDLMPLSIANEMKTSCESRGIEVKYFEQYAQGTTDFSAMLIQVQKANPDWILITGYAEDGLQSIKQLKELNVEPKMLTMIAGAAYKEFIDGLGKDSEYITTACWWHQSVGYEGDDVFKTSANFASIYEAKYGALPDYPVASAASVGCIYSQAIEKANSLDPKAVRDVMDEETFSTFFAPIKFADSGIGDGYIPPVMQIIDGKQNVLYPDDIKTVDLVYPMPGWSER